MGLMVLWSKDYSERKLLLEPSDVKERIVFGEEPYRIDFVEPWKVSLYDLDMKVEAFAESKNTSYLDSEELEEFFAEIGHRAHITGLPFYEDPDEVENVLIYQPCENGFSFGNDYDTVPIYEYWDGSNWKVIEGEDAIAYNLEVTEKKVNLDEWNGRDMITGGVGEHQYVQKILEIDGDKVDGQYLLVYWSQWQGSIPAGEIFTIDELKDHLQGIKRDVDEYIPQIKELD